MQNARDRARRTASAPRSRVDQAFLRLKDLIVSGRLSPGAGIVESQLAGRLGLSRTPVRAALERLRQLGYVHAVGTGKYARLVVAPVSAEDMREVFWVMGSLEGLAAAAAAGLPRAARQRVVEELEELNRGLLAAARARPPELARAQDLHVRFHRVHVEAAAGLRLRTQIDAIHPLAERYERIYTQVLIAEIPTSVREHAEIVAAIAAGDAEAAERAVVRNWRNGAQRCAHAIASFGEAGRW